MKISYIKSTLSRYKGISAYLKPGLFASIGRMLSGYSPLVNAIDDFAKKLPSDSDRDLTLDEEYAFGKILFSTVTSLDDIGLCDGFKQVLWGKHAEAIFNAYGKLKEYNLFTQECTSAIYNHSQKIHHQENNPYYLSQVAKVFTLPNKADFASLKELSGWVSTAYEFNVDGFINLFTILNKYQIANLMEKLLFLLKDTPEPFISESLFISVEMLCKAGLAEKDNFEIIKKIYSADRIDMVTAIIALHNNHINLSKFIINFLKVRSFENATKAAQALIKLKENDIELTETSVALLRREPGTVDLMLLLKKAELAILENFTFLEKKFYRPVILKEPLQRLVDSNIALNQSILTDVINFGNDTRLRNNYVDNLIKQNKVEKLNGVINEKINLIKENKTLPNRLSYLFMSFPRRRESISTLPQLHIRHGSQRSLG